jgi:hypothetical protein
MYVRISKPRTIANIVGSIGTKEISGLLAIVCLGSYLLVSEPYERYY